MASAEVILLDEINRIPLKSQSAFLEALQDRTITVGKNTYDLPTFSFAIATMNPVELGQGTFPLSEAATDRFAAMVNIGYLPPEEEEKLVNFDFKQVRLNPLMSKAAHHRAARADQPAGVPARAARPIHPAAGGGDASVQRRHRLAAALALGSGRARCRSWRLAARDHLLEPPGEGVGAAAARSRRGVPGRHPGPRAVRARPSHLAGTARRRARINGGRGDSTTSSARCRFHEWFERARSGAWALVPSISVVSGSSRTTARAHQAASDGSRGR